MTENNYATKTHLPPKLPLLLQRSPLLSKTLIPWLTPLTTPNGIHIQSAVFPQFTYRRDRETNRWARRQLCSKIRVCSNDCILTRLIIVGITWRSPFWAKSNNMCPCSAPVDLVILVGSRSNDFNSLSLAKTNVDVMINLWGGQIWVGTC